MRAYSKIISVLLLFSLLLSTDHRLLAGVGQDDHQPHPVTPIHVDSFLLIQTLNAVLLNPVCASGKEQIVFGCLNAEPKRFFFCEEAVQKATSRSAFGNSFFILQTRLPGKAVFFLSKILV
jgi:hypothetical protein